MKINIDKIKTMVIAKTKIRTEISIDGYAVKQINHFYYLG